MQYIIGGLTFELREVIYDICNLFSSFLDHESNIKPSNLLLTTDEILKISDFGVAEVKFIILCAIPFENSQILP